MIQNYRSADSLERNDCEDETIKIVNNFDKFVIGLYALLSFIALIFLIQNYLVLAIILILIILPFILLVYPYLIYKKTTRLINEFPERDSETSHHAIIIAHMVDPKSGNYPRRDYLSGADLLIERFTIKSKEINYKVYEVNKKEQVIPVIFDEKTTHLWIFGHGVRNKLGLNGEALCYYEVKDAPKKVFIGQYHCNSTLGKSLGDYNQPPYQDITNFARMDPFIRFSVKKKIKELDSLNLLRKSVPDV